MGRPSKHGANIGAYRSRPLWLEAAGIVGKGIDARRNASCWLDQELARLPTRSVVPAGGVPGPLALIAAFGIPHLRIKRGGSGGEATAVPKPGPVPAPMPTWAGAG